MKKILNIIRVFLRNRKTQRQAKRSRLYTTEQQEVESGHGYGLYVDPKDRLF